MKYLEEALDWGAELIVLGVFINDSEDARDADLSARKEELLPRVPTGLGRTLLQTSRALAWIYMRAENMRRNRAGRAYLEYILDPDYQGWKKFRKAIHRFEAGCRERDARLVAVIWPSMLRLEGGYPNRIAHERIASVLADAAVPYLDLLAEFEDKSSMRLAAYPGIDLHPNEIGHRIGAAAIFNYLVEEGHIDPSYRPAHSWVPSEGHYRKEVRRKLSPEHFPP